MLIAAQKVIHFMFSLLLQSLKSFLLEVIKTTLPDDFTTDDHIFQRSFAKIRE